MELKKLEHHLRLAIPDELYDIKPGQFAYFVPRAGLDVKSSRTLSDIFRFFAGLKKRHNIIGRHTEEEIRRIKEYYRQFRVFRKNEIRISIIHTDNELLIGNIACRSIKEISSPFKISLGPWETIVGLVSEYSGINREIILSKVSAMGGKIRDSITDELPLVIPIDPEKRPVKHSTYIGDDSSDDFGMELLPKRPETEKEKKEEIAKNEKKIKKILRDCAYIGIDIDLDNIVREFEAGKKQTEGYNLSLKMTPKKKSGLIDCQIFLGKDLELKVSPIRKAIYLTFLTLENGLVIEEAKPSFTKRIQEIYKLLPDKVIKEEENGKLGILYTKYIQPQTLRGLMSNINSAIAKLIPNGLIAIEFSIEGERDKVFKVERTTPEIREQIIKAFNL